MVQNGDFFIPYLLSTSPIRESASEYCGKIWYEKKLEWCAHTTLKKSLRIFTRFYAIQERAGQQDRKANGRVERPVQSNDIPSMVQTTESHFCNSVALYSIHRSVSVTHIWLSLGVQLRRHSVPAMAAAAAAAPAAGAAATRIAACGFA